MDNLCTASENERPASAAASSFPSVSQPVLLCGNNQQADAVEPETMADPPASSSSSWRDEVSMSLASPTNQVKPETSNILDGSDLSPTLYEQKPLKKQKTFILHSLVSLARKPSFLQGMLKNSSEVTEKSSTSHISQIAPLPENVSHPKVDSIKSNSWPLSFHDTSSKPASSTTGKSLTLDHLSQAQANNRALRAHFKQKILQLSEQLRVEQTSREENLAEYLELASKVDQHQAAQAWLAFERRNQRASLAIGQLQRRLQNCQSRLQELEHSKQLGNQALTQEMQVLLQSHQTDPLSPSSITATDIHLQPTEYRDYTTNLPESHSGEVSSSAGVFSTTDTPDWTYLSNSEMMDEVAEIKISSCNLEEEQQVLEQKFLTDQRLIQDTLKHEQYRHRQLEVKVNDLLELHQAETGDLKLELTDMEQRVVFQSYHQTKEFLEMLDSFQKRLNKLEQQQNASLEAPERSSITVLHSKLIKLLFAVITVLVVCFSTIYACILPLVKTRWRICTTLAVLVLWAVLWHYWDSELLVLWNNWLLLKLDSLHWKILSFIPFNQHN